MIHPASPSRVSRWLVVTDLALKAAVVLLLVFALTHSHWDRFADKAMGARAVLYPLLIAVPALLWLMARWRAGRAGRPAPPYPLVADVLLTIPFVVDLAGNALDLYDQVSWFDDACHLVNWALLSGAFACAVVGRGLPAWAVFGLVLGFGAVSAVLWEIGEYGAFILDTPESVTAYRDTIGDLALGLSGSFLAALAAAWVTRRDASGSRPTG